VRQSLVLKLRWGDTDLSLFGEDVAAGNVSFGVSGVISFWKSSDVTNERMCLLLLGMRREDKGNSSGGGVDVEESDSRSVASFSDSGETLDSLSYC
jgi:hypothetical protein